MTKYIFLISILGILSGCSIDASYHGPSTEGPVIMAKTMGLTSGSSQSGTTHGTTTYHLQSTVGSYVSGVQQRTVDRTYIVYGSVQGAIISK